MDLSAGGLAPTPRDGASSQAVVDPLDAFLSPLGSPGLPTDAASQAALRAMRGEESETDSTRRRPSLRDASDSAGGRLGPSRSLASGNQDFQIKGSAGSAEKDRQNSMAASKSRSVANTHGRRSYSSRYFDPPGGHAKGSASPDEPAADEFEAGHALTGFECDEAHAQPESVTDISKHGKDSPATQNGARDSIAPFKSQQRGTSGPSQVGADGDNLSVASGGGDGGGGRRYTLTAFRHLARLDTFASEQGRNSPAPESASASAMDDERMDLESEFSVGTGGGARSGHDPTDDGLSVRSGYKRAASEMDRGEYEEEEEEFRRYRRSDTPFNESEYPGDDAASSVRSIGPSRRYGRSRRSRSVAFSQRSLYSERSQDGDGDEESIAPSGRQDSGFYAGEGEGGKPIVTEPDNENGNIDSSEGLLYGDADDDGAAWRHAAENDNEPQYIDFDPLMPMGSIYVSTKHPHLAYAEALAQATKDAEVNAKGQAAQEEQQEGAENQENVAPSKEEARAQGQKEKTTEQKETSEGVIEKWNAARADTVERFGGLMSRVDQLLEGKIQRHEKLDSALSAHQTTLNERFKQLRQTKAGLRQWGNQLFTSLKTAEQESGAAPAAEAETAAVVVGGEPSTAKGQAEMAGGEEGGEVTAIEPTCTGGGNLQPEAAPVATSVDES